ncbi:MAG: hypothetical protein O3C40_28960 [Planctomycetota bacterium]|nr:hypothetical protein [Planctomycetota bacterium]
MARSIRQISLNKLASEIPGLQSDLLLIYAHLWQFETWLRTMAFVELKAFLGDAWLQEVRGFDRSQQADERLTHMPTADLSPLAYSGFSTLCGLIEKHWELFKIYLPPKEIFAGRIDETKQIRNRVAHFRRCHRDDLSRMVQFLRDVDKGFWTFCTSYNAPQPVLPPNADSVVQQFLPYDPFPWSKVDENKWARVGVADPLMKISVTIEVLHRPWASHRESPIAGSQGRLYDVRISSRGRGLLEYRGFLDDTRTMHSSFVHLCLDSAHSSVRITIPAILGQSAVIGFIEKLIAASQDAVRRTVFDSSAKAVQSLADEWPEYVLAQDNPLTFLDPEMPCSFFNT